MLTITIPDREYFDENTEEFVYIKGATLQMEHSLVSISKWEQKWKKPFLGKGPQTKEETLDYARCMTITQHVNPDVYNNLSKDNMKVINNYINDPMTATTFTDHAEQLGGKNSDGSFISSELIYYWMIELNIPVEFQKWHLNRLLTLIRVINAKRQKPEKIPQNKLYSRNAALNAQRRAAMNSKG